MEDTGRDTIRTILAARCPSLAPQQLEQFIRYFRLLEEWNRVMNLTAIVEAEAVAVRHFTDSLTVLPLLEKLGARTVIDVGTGAGFPGIPLKIACPSLSVTLLDALQKRVGFLQTVIAELELTDIQAVHMRAEDAGRDAQFRGQYDAAVARAVAPMPVLAEYCLPFVRVGGHFIAMKGPAQEEYAHACAELGARTVSEDTLTLAGTEHFPENMTRRLICIRLCKNISTKYPRKSGTPQKKPL